MGIRYPSAAGLASHTPYITALRYTWSMSDSDMDAMGAVMPSSQSWTSSGLTPVSGRSPKAGRTWRLHRLS